FDAAIQLAVAVRERAGVAEVAHGDARRVDALLVHEVIAGVVGARERDADTLRRVAVAVNDERAARVLLQLDGDFIETRLVLISDARRVEEEEDRATRDGDPGPSRRRRHFVRRDGQRTTAARTWLAATRAVGHQAHGHGDGADDARRVERHFATRGRRQPAAGRRPIVAEITVARAGRPQRDAVAFSDAGVRGDDVTGDVGTRRLGDFKGDRAV